jgi:hypothetical protein
MPGKSEPGNEIREEEKADLNGRMQTSMYEGRFGWTRAGSNGLLGIVRVKSKAK